jgi:hypothetical protein
MVQQREDRSPEEDPGPGGVGCSGDRRIMQDDQAAQDAAILLASLATNHPQAMRGTAFTLSEDEPHRVGLNKNRFDNAMWWLIQYGFVERDEEAEKLLGKVEDPTEYDYGLAFKITERGRTPLREAGRDDPS